MVTVGKTKNLELSVAIKVQTKCVTAVYIEVFWHTKKDWQQHLLCSLPYTGDNYNYAPTTYEAACSLIPDDLKDTFKMEFKPGNVDSLREIFFKSTNQLCADAQPYTGLLYLIDKSVVKSFLDSRLKEFGLSFVDITYWGGEDYSIEFNCREEYALITKDGLTTFNSFDFEEVLDGEDEFKAFASCLLEEKEEEIQHKIDDAINDIFEIDPGEAPFQPY